MSEFSLHPQLIADTVFVKDLALCRVLLMKNALFPWLILVPRKEGMIEVFDLNDEDRLCLIEEVSHSAKRLKKAFKSKKINIAALGNQVPQLHVHVVARSPEDAAWPNPVWGKGFEEYTQNRLDAVVRELQKIL